MKKRLLSVLLAVVLAFGFVSPALAGDGYLPATAVLFFGNIGYGAGLNIDTDIVVNENCVNEEISEFPVLYRLENGGLTLVRECTAYDWGMGASRSYDANGNPLQWQANISIFFTEDEYNAFDFNADYVLEMPEGIFMDVNGDPIGEKFVSFSGADIVINRYELTLFGQLFYYLWSFNTTRLFRLFISPLTSFLMTLVNVFNIPIIK